MPWGLQWKCKFCVSRAISEYWQAGGIDGGDGYCGRQVQSARIRISLDVLAENHLPALPISPAGAANPFIQSLTTCRQGLTQNGQSQGLSRQYPSDRTSFASILPRILPVHPGCSACQHPVSACRSLCQAEALDGDDDNANSGSNYSTNF